MPVGTFPVCLIFVFSQNIARFFELVRCQVTFIELTERNMTILSHELLKWKSIIIFVRGVEMVPKVFCCVFVFCFLVAVGVKGEFRRRVEGYRIKNQASYHENTFEGLFQD